jgi:acetyl esterase
MAESTPLVPAPRAGPGKRALLLAVGSAVRASLLVSPRPAAMLVRKVFALGGAEIKKGLDRHAPSGLTVLRDEPYGDEDTMRLDVVFPEDTDQPLPLVLWMHGGGWIGGTKDELTGYFGLIADSGYVVVAPDYGLAPEHRYPTPVRHAMQALDHAVSHAERFHIDADRIVVAGDSAGAHIAAQLAALVTTPGYADRVGVAPTIAPAQLRGLVLACGPFDPALARHTSSPAGRRFIHAVLWAYSGTRRYLDDPAFATWSITDHLTPAFPPTLITVGNADPLRPHSEHLAEVLHARGVDAETVFWPDDHEPPLGHEYQFDLDTDAGQFFLYRLRAFLRRSS